MKNLYGMHICEAQCALLQTYSYSIPLPVHGGIVMQMNAELYLSEDQIRVDVWGVLPARFTKWKNQTRIKLKTFYLPAPSDDAKAKKVLQELAPAIMQNDNFKFAFNELLRLHSKAATPVKESNNNGSSIS